MMEELSKQDQEFVKGFAVTDNGTKSAQEAYGIEDPNYAGVKANRMLRNDKINTAIQEVKRTLAERIPEELLEKVLIEGLGASKITKQGEAEITEPDYAVRHKYLDTGLKIKGAYAPEKSINLDLNVDITNPEARQLAEKYEEELKKGL